MPAKKRTTAPTLQDHIDQLGTAVDEAAIRAWGALVRGASKGRTPGWQWPLDDSVALYGLAEVLARFVADPKARKLAGAEFVSLFLGDAGTFLLAASFFDNVPDKTLAAALAPHGPALLDAAAHGRKLMAEVAKAPQKTRYNLHRMDESLGALLAMAERVGFPAADKRRFQQLVIEAAHGSPGLEGFSEFAAHHATKDLFVRVAKQAPGAVAFSSRPSAPLLRGLAAAGKSEGAVARILTLVTTTATSAVDASWLFERLREAYEHRYGGDEPLAIAPAVAKHAAAIVGLTEKWLAKRKDWSGSASFVNSVPTEGESIATAVSAALVLLEASKATTKYAKRVAVVLERLATELPRRTPYLNALRHLGSDAIPILVRILHHAITHAKLKKALESLRYSSSDDELSAHVVECFYELSLHPDEAARAALATEASTWTVEQARVFLTLVASDAHVGRMKGGRSEEGEEEAVWSKRGRAVGRAVSAFSPAVQKATAQLASRARKAAGEEPRPKLPKKPPASLDEAFDLLETLGLAASDIPLGKPASAADLKSLPKELRALYERWNGVGSREIAAIKSRASLTKNLKEAATEAIADPDADPWTLSKPAALVAIGRNSSGDFYFLDPAAGDAVHCFDHASQEVDRVAKDLPAFVGRVILARWGELAAERDYAWGVILKWPTRDAGKRAGHRRG